MTIKSHKVLLVRLILAFVCVTLNLFPRVQSTNSGLPAGPGGAAQDRNELMLPAEQTRGSLPVIFEANRGQADDDVRFVGRGAGLGLLLKDNEVVFSLRTPQSLPPDDKLSGLLTMKLEGANSNPYVLGTDIQEVRANYFIGNDPLKWVRGVETYSRVLYSAVYDGIDLLFYGNDRRLEYDFNVAPGADPKNIQLRFDGIAGVELGSEGALILHTEAGNVRHERPFAFQDRNGSRCEVAASFKQLDNGAIGFEIGAYDASIPLVIDPILVYSTYLGGSADDFARGVVADSAGNLFLTGDSFSSDFLRTATPTNSDVFIGKLASNGLLLSYTFFGGGKNDTATALNVDAAGNIYMAGSTQSPDFPIFNSIGQFLNGNSDAFAVKLTPAGDQFFYSSLVGGSGEETGVSIAADTIGNAYLSGRTSSQDYPTFAPIQPAYGGGASDAFISKIMPDGKSFSYSTFLGGGAAENEGGRSGISIDSAGNAYVVGDTQSVDFPTSNALRTTKSGSATSSDGFAAKIDPTGTNFIYATYLGGSEDDSAFAIGADKVGNAYVTGRTKSTSFTGSGVTRPTTATSDAFVAKLNANGSALSYLTFIGGAPGDESGNAIVVDSSGNAVIAGSAGEGVPTTNSVQSFSRGGGDAFVAKLGQNGAVTFSSYLGGSAEDTAQAVGLDAEGSIYFAGFTSSTDLVTASPLVRENRGGRDILIAKIDPDSNSDGPVLLQAVISGPNLILFGQGFDAGAKLRVNDVQVKTRNEDPNPTQILFAKKAAKRISSGSTVQLQVRNANGKRSNFLFFTKP